MSHPTRRRFLAHSAAAMTPLVLHGAASPLLADHHLSKRKFTLCLTPSSIGASGDFEMCLEWCLRYGYESLVPNRFSPASLSDAQISETRARLAEHHLSWGAFGPPVDPRTDDEDSYRQGLAELPAVAAALQKLGVDRLSTWVSPHSRTMTYRKLFDRWARRLRQIGPILADHGQRLGLEYIGTPTLRNRPGYPFLHTAAGLKELLAEADQPNIGFTLDSWHWYTAGESHEDLLALSNERVVACDLNDAPAGIPVERQIDGQRELPMATGVIDTKGFLSALVEIGYDGPVRPEPFNADLNAMDDEPAVARTAEAMKKAFALVA